MDLISDSRVSYNFVVDNKENSIKFNQLIECRRNTGRKSVFRDLIRIKFYEEKYQVNEQHL